MATLDVLTLAEAKDALNLANTTAHDEELPAWITGVSLRLDELVGPVVQRTITAENQDGGGHLIFLEHHPITSITSVTEYDNTTATTLTEETNSTKPTDGFLTDRYSADRTLLSNILRRRSDNADAFFPPGRNNVEITYVAGRFADTASVDERYKRAAALMVINLWRSQQDSTGNVGEFDVPQLIFPTFSVPRAVRELLNGELQDPLPL
ncbi:hypothetical protein GCM10012275_38290 [Longimycelium tulufanense]|uniref:Phage gp6-like head-tail connector protein n=1 Tax=Longimycelium tulufanense TaxID=907463 RepID=A0A8J3CA56_9PSEU|nr:hypothetical protein [Longimycelium tulufanense]GGM64102.1 hypothetical protein GCM10012275_38290 [Longimycelium tulufanense]